MLKKAQKKLISQVQAGAELGLTGRHVRRLVKQLEARGEKAVIHALRGKPSNRKLSEPMREKILAILSQAHYRDFGPTAASAELASKHDIRIGREALRQLLIAAGRWRAQKQWRQRWSCRGGLVQRDTSEHDWLEGRGDKLYLIAMIDDASSESTARFSIHDSSDENMRLLRDYLKKNGRPVGFYTDKASLFQTAPKVARGQKHWPKTNASRYRLPRLDALCRSCK